jgi:hypothetical protein
MTSVPSPADDRAAIADLVHGYALAVRRADPAGAAALFTANGAFETREADPRRWAEWTRRSRAEGRETIAAFIGRSTGRVHMLPMIHNLIVTLDGDRATASSLMVGRQWPGGAEVAGEYADSVLRTAGGWRFLERIYTIYRESSPAPESTSA